MKSININTKRIVWLERIVGGVKAQLQQECPDNI